MTILRPSREWSATEACVDATSLNAQRPAIARRCTVSMDLIGLEPTTSSMPWKRSTK